MTIDLISRTSRAQHTAHSTQRTEREERRERDERALMNELVDEDIVAVVSTSY